MDDIDEIFDRFHAPVCTYRTSFALLGLLYRL